jgi:hypothetical protein
MDSVQNNNQTYSCIPSSEIFRFILNKEVGARESPVILTTDFWFISQYFLSCIWYPISNRRINVNENLEMM